VKRLRVTTLTSKRPQRDTRSTRHRQKSVLFARVNKCQTSAQTRNLCQRHVHTGEKYRFCLRTSTRFFITVKFRPSVVWFFFLLLLIRTTESNNAIGWNLTVMEKRVWRFLILKIKILGVLDSLHSKIVKLRGIRIR